MYHFWVASFTIKIDDHLHIPPRSSVSTLIIMLFMFKINLLTVYLHKYYKYLDLFDYNNWLTFVKLTMLFLF